MKNTLVLPLTIILVFTMAISAFLYITDAMIVRSPILVAKKPFVNFVLGDVQYKLEQNDWEKLATGMILDDQSSIKTGNRAKADISFSNGMTIRVEQNSILNLDEININNKTLKLETGSIYGHFSKEHEKQKITVITPTAVAGVRGTELGFEIIEEEIAAGNDLSGDDKAMNEDELTVTRKSTVIYTKSGIVEVWSPGRKTESILLAHQKKTVLADSEPPRDPEPFSVEDTERLQNLFNSIHENEVIVISTNIRFDTGKAVIRKDSYRELDSIAKKLNSRSETVRIEGHTDNTGTASFNQELSVRRSEAIKNYLVNKGVSENRLKSTGFGSSRPVAPNTTDAKRALNRRVEFTVID